MVLGGGKGSSIWISNAFAHCFPSLVFVLTNHPFFLFSPYFGTFFYSLALQLKWLCRWIDYFSHTDPSALCPGVKFANGTSPPPTFYCHMKHFFSPLLSLSFLSVQLSSLPVCLSIQFMSIHEHSSFCNWWYHPSKEEKKRERTEKDSVNHWTVHISIEEGEEEKEKR